jgi:hypothetical protein
VSDEREKRTFTIEITGYQDEEAVARVRDYLRSVFPERPPEAIDRAMERQPLRFRAQATPERAVRLQQALVSRGALAILLESGTPPASAETRPAEPVGTPAPEPAGEPPPPPETEPAREPAPAPPVETRAAPPAEEPSSPTAVSSGIVEAALDDHPLPDPREEPPAAPPPNEFPPEEAPLFFWNAWAAAVFSPRRFFRTLHAPGGTVRALLFAAVLGLLAAVLSFPARTLGAFENGVIDKMGLTERYLILVFMEPLATVIATCFIAWLLHFGLRIMAGPRPFEVTLKVVAYTTAAGVFAAIPRAGSGIAALLALVLTLVGLSSAQRVRPIQAMGAVVFPVLFLAGVLLATLGGLALGGFLILEALRS